MSTGNMHTEESVPKPVKVDNWGIYLLQRLHNFYTKSIHTDLVLRFPKHDEGTIYLHRLVFEASTDWLTTREEASAPIGDVEMPQNLSPRDVLPVITFMYTGKLLAGEANYDQIKATAELLRMSVLIKVIDDAKTRKTSTMEPPNPKRSKHPDHPLQQIRRIENIQKKYGRSKAAAASAAKEANDQQEMERLPGKKLPIWKKRSIIPTSSDSKESEIPESHKFPSASYGKKFLNSDNANGDSIPPKEVLFDQVLETGLKKMSKSLESSNNTREESSTGEDIDDGMRELLEEQRKRLTLRDDETSDPEEDCHMDDDDFIIGGESDEAYFVGQEESTTTTEGQTNPSDDLSQNTPLKVVRFSLTPSASTAQPNTSSQKDIFPPEASPTSNASTDDPPSTNASQKLKPPPSKGDTVIKVVASSNDKKTVIADLLKKNPNLLKEHRRVKLKIISRGDGAKPGVQYVTLRASDCQVNIPPLQVPGKAPPDKRQSSTKQRVAVNRSSSLSGEFKPAPKVMYTGRRGRPKQIKEGEFDPHEQVREEINQRLSGNGYYVADKTVIKQPGPDQVQVQKAAAAPSSFESSAHEHSSGVMPIPIHDEVSQQPSSEAEAMSKVASDIAASINLVSPDFATEEGTSGTSSSGFNDPPPQGDSSYSIPSTSSKPPLANDNINNNISDNNKSSSVVDQELDKVSSLVLEWDEEDEIEEMRMKN